MQGHLNFKKEITTPVTVLHQQCPFTLGEH